MKQILDDYYSFSLCSQDNFDYQAPSGIATLSYNLKNEKNDPVLGEAMYFGEKLFQLFETNEILSLLAAVMLEKTVIFVSSSNAVLSSCV